MDNELEKKPKRPRISSPVGSSEPRENAHYERVAYNRPQHSEASTEASENAEGQQSGATGYQPRYNNRGYNNQGGYNRPYNNRYNNQGGGYNNRYNNQGGYNRYNNRPQQQTSDAEGSENAEGQQQQNNGYQPRYNNNRYNNQGGYNRYNNHGGYNNRGYNNHYTPRPRPDYNRADVEASTAEGSASTESAATAEGAETAEGQQQNNGYQPRYNNNRYNNQGGYNRGYNNRQGGYNNRPGYNNNRQGGYNNRPGGYNNNRPGGYNNNRPGGYNNNRPGGYNKQQGGPARFNKQTPRPGKSFTPRPKRIEYEMPIPDPNEQIRLNKFMANAGICSRREADEFIEQGLVKVNGEVVTELGTKISHSDVVEYDDKVVALESKCYILLNKPKDCVTTSDDPNGRLTVMDLVKGACPERIYPVGRLDRNTTGVLLLTNDGDLASKLTHPKYVKKKIYHVWCDKDISEDDMQRIADGIELEDGPIHADAISYATETDRNQAGIEIHSGKNRIVRRIFESLGYHVTKLDRVYFAGLTKKNLPRGRWRYLTQEEVNYLKMGSFD
ncbi:MAG: rRNA pseudouridine synthase [Muribaculaceae bacterium]|nr:rRNA pseudouridine synthase [Muribaculaceae bacterium]